MAVLDDPAVGTCSLEDVLCRTSCSGRSEGKAMRFSDMAAYMSVHYIS